MAIGVAFKAFFATLFDREVSHRVQQALDGSLRIEATASAQDEKTGKPQSQAASAPRAQTPPAPARSEALTLLSTLQREARLLDLVHESLDGFEDAQVGAAAREVLRDCRKTLDRLFNIEPLSEVEEGEKLSVDAQASPNRLRVTGNTDATHGEVTHRGWKASRCEVPKWNGKRDDAWVLAPVEVDA
ncbi:DUF2760 domain-containing protein [Aureliella helgolandensis]|uniref:DUF2760 domain-containing protein n=1 Tax=Aureliella helgolandensis TaxID=2527968 RepID=A0A518FZT0_9BACT|nr:DUF2760 domain-containing protein [Aureliella helgolandensis]QDV21816.1 hypothetical protein Q31a_00950 [Aureliella helgolandensis]